MDEETNYLQLAKQSINHEGIEAAVAACAYALIALVDRIDGIAAAAAKEDERRKLLEKHDRKLDELFMKALKGE